MLELYPDNHLSFWPSLLTAALCLLGPLAIWLETLRRSRRLRQEQNAEKARFSEPLPALAVGPAVLRGRVEPAQGSSKLVVQEIVQRGHTLDFNPDSTEPRTKKHIWKEIERVTHAEAFYVADARGERVRVEPDGGIRLGGTDDKLFGLHKNTRMVVRELEPGTDVYVSGTLVEAHDPERSSRDYRSSARAVVLRPDPRAGMYVGLIEPSSRFGPALRHLRIAHYVALAALLAFAAALVPYAASLFFGETVIGRVAIKEAFKTDAWEVLAQDPAATDWSVWDRFDADDGPRIQKGQQIAVRRAPLWATSRIAPHASLNAWYLVCMVLSWLVLLAALSRQPKPESDVLESSAEGPLPNALHAYPLAIRDPARDRESRYRKGR